MPIFRVGAPRARSKDSLFAALEDTDEDGDLRSGEAATNMVSALFSAASLIVSLTQRRAMNFLFQTWVSFIPAVRAPASMQLVHSSHWFVIVNISAKGVQASPFKTC